MDLTPVVSGVIPLTALLAASWYLSKSIHRLEVEMRTLRELLQELRQSVADVRLATSELRDDNSAVRERLAVVETRVNNGHRSET